MASTVVDRRSPAWSTSPARLAVVGLVVLHVVLALLYAVSVPVWNAPDEPAHFNYVRDVAGGRLPVLSPGDWDSAQLERLKAARFPAAESIDAIRYESHQPPLYYALLAPAQRVVNETPLRTQAVALRCVTALLSGLAIAATALVAARVAPNDPLIPVATVAVAGLIPMRLAVGSSISNDVLAELLVTIGLWRALIEIEGGGGRRHAIILGALMGLALVTKLSAYVLLVLLPLAIVVGRHDSRLPRLLIAAVTAAVLGGWWLARNLVVYGLTDPLGQRRHFEVVTGQPLTGEITWLVIRDALEVAFRSFWGQFGWMGVVLDSRLYLFFAIVTAVASLGILLYLRPGGRFWNADAARRRAILFISLAAFLVVAGVIGYNSTYFQPQGRYLFPALAPISLAFAIGLREVVRPRRFAIAMTAYAAGFAVLDVLILYRYILPDLVRMG